MTIQKRIENARRIYANVLAKKGARAAEKYRVRLTGLLLRARGM